MTQHYFVPAPLLETFHLFSLLILPTPCRVLISILQMTKLRLGTLLWLAKGHRAREGRTMISGSTQLSVLHCTALCSRECQFPVLIRIDKRLQNHVKAVSLFSRDLRCMTTPQYWIRECMWEKNSKGSRIKWSGFQSVYCCVTLCNLLDFSGFYFLSIKWS